MLGLFRFGLHFSIFGNVTEFFYVPDFFYVSKKFRKSLGHRKVSVLVFFTNKNFKKTRQKRQSPNIFLKKTQKKFGTQKSVGTLSFFDFIFLNLSMLQRFSMSHTFSKFLDGHALNLNNLSLSYKGAGVRTLVGVGPQAYNYSGGKAVFLFLVVRNI